MKHIEKLSSELNVKITDSIFSHDYNSDLIMFIKYTADGQKLYVISEQENGKITFNEEVWVNKPKFDTLIDIISCYDTVYVDDLNEFLPKRKVLNYLNNKK